MPVKIKGHLRGSEGIFDEVEECCSAMTNAAELSIPPRACVAIVSVDVTVFIA